MHGIIELKMELMLLLKVGTSGHSTLLTELYIEFHIRRKLVNEAVDVC